MRLSLVLLSLFMMPMMTVQSAELAKPTGPVVLTVTGNIALTNDGDTAIFDLAMLDALSQHSTTTITPWYEGEQTFSGTIIADLLESLGAEGQSLTVTAINDYAAEIPLADFANDKVILASRINGGLLSVRDRGPLFVIYPFDQNASLYNEVYFGRSVWQVKSITVH